MLTVSDMITDQLDLDELDIVEVELADGNHCKRTLVGHVTVLFKNRKAICLALVFLGIKEVLLGAISLEGMDRPHRCARGTTDRATRQTTPYPNESVGRRLLLRSPRHRFRHFVFLFQLKNSPGIASQQRFDKFQSILLR